MRSTCAGVLTLLLSIILLGSCSKKGDMNSILKTVPADAAFVVTFNAEEILDQLDYKVEGEHAVYCQELTDLFKSMGVESKDVAEFTDAIDMTEKVVVVYSAGQHVFMTASLKSGGDFSKWYEKVAGEKLLDDGDGFMSGNHGRLIVKDNRLWVSDDKIDTKEIDKLLELKNEKSFAGKYPKSAEEMCEDDNVVCAFVNIDEVLSTLRKVGAVQETAQVQLALGMAFKDAKSVMLTSSLSDDKIESTLTVLNSDEKPADFLIPMGKINPEAMNKVDNNAFIVGAVDFSQQFIDMLSGLVERYGVAMDASDRAVINMLLSLQGTSAFSFSGENAIVASVGFKDAASAAQVADFLGQADSRMQLSTAGNFLVLRMGSDVAAGGSAPAGFKDNFMAVQIDYSNPALKQLIPVDMTNMGKVLMVLGPDGKGLRLKSTWTVKQPVKTCVKCLNNMLPVIFGAQAIGAFVPEDDDDTPMADIEF